MAAMSAPTSLADLGWDPGWATAFQPFDAAEARPARVVAAHRVVVLGVLPLGAAAGGAMAELASFRFLFGCCGALGLATMIPAAHFWRDEVMDAEEARASSDNDGL